METDVRCFLTQATEQQDCTALQSAYRLIRGGKAAGHSGRTPRVSPRLYVLCAETALQLHCLEISEECLQMYFGNNPQKDQFLCRAYLCHGQLMTLSAAGTVDDFPQAVEYFLKAIAISKQEPKFHFMVFNASVLYFQTVRPLLQPGRCAHLVPSLTQVVQSLEEVADQDHSWRAELMMHLIRCVVDSGNIKDAKDVGKVTEEFVKCHTPHLHPRLFSLLVQHNLTDQDVISEITRQNQNLEVTYKIQEFKNRLEEMNKGEMKTLDLAKLEEIFHLLVDTTGNHSPPPLQPADRVALLLELALLALEAKHQKVAVDCLKELKSSRAANFGQRILMKCVNSQINMLKKGAKMNDYSRASVEARLKEIGKLDQWLQSAMREGDPQAVQAVCATQWRLCLPLLQHNLRKRIRTPMHRVIQGLEDIHSLFLEMRCQIHSEMALIEEEEGRLEASLTHLQKAIKLDTGSQRERLSRALHLLQLRGTLNQNPSCNTDKAAVLLQQVKDLQSNDETEIRPALVTVGLLLAPDDFQIVLDGDQSSFGSGPEMDRRSANVRHHFQSLQILNGHLSRQASDTDHMEKIKSWATLVKTARKHEVWDVCRAACRFCLLYDDGRWQMSRAEGENISKTDDCSCSQDEGCGKCPGCLPENIWRKCLRLLAEIYFISAEATIQQLFKEGVQLNRPAIPPRTMKGQECDEDPQWVTYRDWIQDLSAYVTSSFLRAAQLGLQIKEQWLVENAAIYMWNYSRHSLVAEDFQLLLPSFQCLVKMLRELQNPGNRTVVVLLCNAVARGLIQPVCGAETIEPTLTAEKGKNRAERPTGKTGTSHGVSSDAAAPQDVQKALELCEYALHISKSNSPGEMVPIASKKQVLATWVQIKMLLQQQIHTNDVKDENEDMSALMHVLVGVEMLQCNKNPRRMEFTVPSLCTLVTTASQVNWTDSVTELQVWCQLAAFCLSAQDHSLVLRCTEKALHLGEAAAKSTDTTLCLFNDLKAVNEMLSSVSSMRGLGLAHVSSGDVDIYREALEMFSSSVSYAEKADNVKMCITAAKHYWNTCLPLARNPGERSKVRDHLEKILGALSHTGAKHKKVQTKGFLTLRAIHTENKQEATDEEELSVRAAIYRMLLCIHVDKTDRKSALQLLDRAGRELNSSSHTLDQLKLSIRLKARLGESVQADMQKLQKYGEQCSSFMWRQVALYAKSTAQQLYCYHQSVTSLQSPETQWQKANVLLEFGEWLYRHNFSKSSAQQQVQWAIDIVLQQEPETREAAEEESEKMGSSAVEHQCLFGVQGPMKQNLFSVKHVQHLDFLVQAHTVLAVMADRASPEHQLYLLTAATFVLQIWQVSIDASFGLYNEMSRSRLLKPPLSAGSKKGKDKTKNRKDAKVTTPAEERPKTDTLDWVFPTCTKDWACFTCPDWARELIRTSSDSQCINKHTINTQHQSIFYLNLLEKELHSLSLYHLTLPTMHLAETIAHDLLDKRSLADFYRLKILGTCSQLGLETSSPYHKTLLSLCRNQEPELMQCHKVIALSQEGRLLNKPYNEKAEQFDHIEPWQQNIHIWLDKAELCLSMGLYQAARQLMADAHTVAKKLAVPKAMAKSLLSFADLACKEQNHAEALILLEKAQTFGGDEQFWYHFSLTKVRAVVGQKDEDAQNRADHIIKQGCEALKLVMEQQENRAPELMSMITLLKLRGAVECLCVIGEAQPGETVSPQTVQRLMVLYNTLRDCGRTFTELCYKQKAVEAHEKSTQCVRMLVKCLVDEKKKKLLLLDGLSQMQQAVTLQEQVALNAQSLAIQQEETCGMSALHRLQHLRLTLAELSLTVLEEHCSEVKSQALSRESKTSAELALEEFTRSTPEPGSLEQVWTYDGQLN